MDCFASLAMTWLALRLACGRLKKGDVTPGRVGQHGDPRTSHRATRHRAALVTSRLHIVVVRILADVADIEDDGFLAEVLPPVRGAEHFGPDLAGLVQDRLGAVAGVFDDLALLHEDQRRTVVMAVPRHDAAGLDRQLAEAQLAILDVGGLLLEIDRTERDVGDADLAGPSSILPPIKKRMEPGVDRPHRSLTMPS